MIESTSSMDRPVVGQRNPRLIAGGAIASVAVLVVLVAVFPAIRRWSKADRAVDASTLRLSTVTRGDLLRDLSVEAKVVAPMSPTLFSPGQGIVSLRTHAGVQVRQGDVLAVIDSKELRAALDQANAQLLTSRAELDRQQIVTRQTEQKDQQQIDLLTLKLAASKRQLERVERLFNEGLANSADHETAQDNVRIAAMELEQAKSQQKLTHESLGFEVATREQQTKREESVVGELQKRNDDLTIRAPFDGMVSTVAVQDRDAVAPNQAVLSVVNLSTLELQITLPEEYANEASVGTPAAITFNGRTYPGKVIRISPEVVNSELPAAVAFDGEKPAGLRQNQRLTTRLTFESKQNVLKVQRGGFLEAEGGRACYVVEGKMATRREIKTGATSIGEVEILNGLKEGDTIVVSDTTPFQHATNVMLR
ncbi:MAG TPA: efflux RND transporter periplasmic adaptor subunit [Thermoanaerobaculia bacterium]|nr:efflux RND transporter periplasmic adaptor subunit [Thermoanaerobaculia bacterium]